MWIGLGPGRGDVDLVLAEAHLGGGEALVFDHLAAEPPGERRGIALDHQVDVGSALTKQQIADCAADQIHRFSSSHIMHDVQLGVGAAQCLFEVVNWLHRHRHPYHDRLPGWSTSAKRGGSDGDGGFAGTYSRTAIPALARCRLASRTRYVP